MNNNPYQSPQSHVADDANHIYEPSFFAFTGRIGRLRYLSYSLFTYLLATIPIAPILLISNTFFSNQGVNESTYGLLNLSTIIAIMIVVVFSISIAVRRLHDLNRTGWLLLLNFVPLINIFFFIYLTCFSGTASNNRFGLQPNQNPWWMWIGLLVPITSIAVLLALAIPAYQDYVIRVQEAAQSLP